MSLFQKSVEKKYLNELDTILIDRKYKDFQSYFGNPAIQENIRNAKEEQFQEGFLRELFVSVFGYTLNPHPNFNLTTELKNIANSKKADGAILKGEDAVAVIELKGTDTTDLDKIETQAFGYKNHHPKCVYVITSNFEKLRFYIQNAVDHLDFDLFNLSREQFSLMWLCLAKDNLLNGLPQKIKESSLLQEENITKKLYADYSKFRKAIYNNLVTNNPETDKLLLFRKTQKLIDRFLFIFFAEDRLLVPPNSISQIIEKWKDDVDFGDAKPLYHTFKKYFHVLNVGRPKSGNRQEIFAYNGGLFNTDEILDNIIIDDNILFEHTLKLSQYDYETDVDVNILGHIFEHSLGDIENVQAEIKGEKVDNQKTKRKKDGIFYTPKYITKYIVENTVGKLCKEKRAELEIIDEEYSKGRKNRKKDTITALDKKLTEYRNWLLSLTILDPACGSGAFLNQALDFLITEHRKIDDLRAQLFGSGLVFSDITTDILEKNIYGVDINEESVEIAKLSLWLRTAQKGRKLNKLNNNIKCGNSLIDDPEVAGEKAFNWQNEFPEIFKKKEKKAWHVTTATHNSRYSQRMFDSFVKLGEPVWLSEKEEIIVSETIAEIVEKDKLNILAYNICGDHTHILLVCEEEELPKVVQKIKSMSARACNIAMGRTIPAAGTTEHAPSSGEPDSGQTGEHAPREGRGKTQFHLWTQKFGQKEITSEEQLQNTIEYIRNNRKKHGLDGQPQTPQMPNAPQQNEGACSLVDTPPVDSSPSDTPTSGFLPVRTLAEIATRITCTHEHAFRTEHKGGFDVVIGNPPYVRVQNLNYEIIDWLKNNKETAHKRIDISILFIEEALKLVNNHGLISFITSNQFFKAEYGRKLREKIKGKLYCNLDFSNVSVFEGLATYVSILNLSVQSNVDLDYAQIVDTEINLENIIWHKFNFDNFSDDAWDFNLNQSIKNKLYQGSIFLGDCADFIYGIISGYDAAFIVSKEEAVKYNLEKEILFEFVKPENYSRYGLEKLDKFIIYPYDNNNTIYSEDLLKNQFPNTYKYLYQHKEILENRKDSRFTITEKGLSWYIIMRRIDSREIAKSKIIFYDVGMFPNFYLDANGVAFGGGTSHSLSVKNNTDFQLEYLLALLNSKLIGWIIQDICPVKMGGARKYGLDYMRRLPIRKIALDNQKQFMILSQNITYSIAKLNSLKTQFLTLLQGKFEIEKISKKLQIWYELEFKEFLEELQKVKIKLRLSEEAEWMNYFNEQKEKAQTLKSEIEKTDREIDRMVYELYDLTDEEIKIVEDSV